ncbi:AraC family transcriptional regulator [Nocardia bhagyanarayanae]|uniref:AraC-like DNA-binding protein n=1 Tax=Nocardia bhagyanarayanae TaxID=1215925 RepID=A0A543FC89_9NOCA|nr:AraC family transcriptional regulator [Nocardia bhagyanarayanae]TQM31453.1 AraC-like DNA-binding protein [Nocardia bhagyanarayanae]
MFTRTETFDALSEILDAVRLHGDIVLRCAPPPPFRVTVPGGVRMLHIVEQGELRLRAEGGGEMTLEPGDLVLLARGDAHTLYTDPNMPERPLRPSDLFRTDDELADPGTPRWVTGTFAVQEAIAGPLLSVLPAVVHIPAGRGDLEWLAVSLRLLLAEVTAASPGAAVMISRILDLLFIHTLRTWFAGNSASPGWLTAAMDPALGPVLAAIHRDPGRPWTVTDLAATAALSRSSFAERFTRLLGSPPAAYLTERRLDRAAHLLRATTEPVSRIADDVGYRSDAAFSRAFQRKFGAPPLRWRRSGARPNGDGFASA